MTRFRDILESVAKKGGYEILLSLYESPKKWGTLERIVKDKQAVSFRLREFLNMGLIQISVRFDTPTGSKYYALTPIGQKIAQKLKEMQEDYEDYLSKAPPKGKEFLDWEPNH